MPERLTIIDDLSNPRIKQRVIAQIGALQGVYRVEVCKYRPRRSDRQNRYYHPCFVDAFLAHLQAEGNDIDHDGAHEILKARFLRTQIVVNGERLPYVQSTAELTTVEFNEYLEKCAAFLSELGIVVPEPNVWREPEEASV